MRPYGDARPRIDASAWLAPGSVVIGDVEIGADSSVWYGAVIRGDVNFVRIGRATTRRDEGGVDGEDGE